MRRAGLRRRGLWIVPAVMATLLLAQVSGGHAILLSRGEAIVYGDRIEVRIEVAAEDFLHYSSIAVDGEGLFWIDSLKIAARQHGQVMSTTLVVRDSAGRRLPTAGASVQADWPGARSLTDHELRRVRVWYTLVFPLAQPQSLLTFQLDGEGLPGLLPSQVVVAVRGADQAEGTTLRLTNRGNPETVELRSEAGSNPLVRPAWPDRAGACFADEERGPARFKDIFAEFVVDRGRLSARILVPLPLLATWIGAGPSGADFVEPAEQCTTFRSIQELVSKAVEPRVDGRPVTCESVSLMMLHADGRRTGLLDGAMPASRHTARLEVSISFVGVAELDHLVLRWQLFNNAVLRAEAAVHDETGCREFELTVSEPAYAWNREPA